MSPIVLTFMSGKGGTGKTSVCVTAGQLLALAGLKVVAADLDFATFGMTHFFEQKYADALDSEDQSRPASPLEVYKHTSGGWLKVALRPEAFEADRYLSAEGEVHFVERLLQTVEVQQSDVLLLDCQAGLSMALRPALEVSTHRIVVTEADPISVAAVVRLTRDLGPSGRKITGLVNRVYPGEEPYYEALTDLVGEVQFKALLPYDGSVRRAVFRRQLPLEEDSATPFTDALQQFLEHLEPRFAHRFASSPAIESARLEATREVDRLLELRRNLEMRLLVDARRRVFSLMPIALSLLASLMALVLDFADVLTRTAGLIGSLTGVVLALVGTFGYLYTRGTAAIVRGDSTRRLLDAVNRRLDEYFLSGSLPGESRDTRGNATTDPPYF